ncbi:MAG: hypothetical protein AAGG11_05415 [Pseudomonadota bacterium]
MRWLIVLVLILGAAAVYYFAGVREQATALPVPKEPLTEPSQEALPQASESVSSSSLPPAERDGLEPQPASATDPLRAAAERVRLAEAELESMDLELERFELLVADIEARGEDPADYAEDVMLDFQPLLNRFLDAQAELDAAVAELEQLEAAGGAPAAAPRPLR